MAKFAAVLFAVLCFYNVQSWTAEAATSSSLDPSTLVANLIARITALDSVIDNLIDQLQSRAQSSQTQIATEVNDVISQMETNINNVTEGAPADKVKTCVTSATESTHVYEMAENITKNLNTSDTNILEPIMNYYNSISVLRQNLDGMIGTLKGLIPSSTIGGLPTIPTAAFLTAYNNALANVSLLASMAPQLASMVTAVGPALDNMQNTTEASVGNLRATAASVPAMVKTCLENQTSSISV